MTKWLDSALIKSKINYCLCLSQKEYVKVLKRLNVDTATSTEWVVDGTAAASTHHWILDSGKVSIVCVNLDKEAYKEDPICIAGVLVHEATHIWQEFCEDIGEKHPSREFEAYSIQWISQELMWEYKRRMKNE